VGDTSCLVEKATLGLRMEEGVGCDCSSVISFMLLLLLFSGDGSSGSFGSTLSSRTG